MTKMFLAAGVAALAISAPAAARPGGGGGGGGGAHMERANAGAMRAERQAPRVERQQQRAERPQMMRAERQQFRAERPQFRAERQQARVERPQRIERQARVERPQRIERQARVERPQRELRANRVERAQPRVAERRQVRDARVERQARVADRRDLRANRVERVQPRVAERQQMQIDRRNAIQNRIADRRDLRAERIEQRLDRNAFGPRYANNGDRALINGCPPGLAAKFNGCLPPGQAKKLIGAPVAVAATYGALNSFPQSVSYLYPDTPDYYYRYGDGYAYRIDRSSNLISALLPLIAGGYMPGQYLPNYYMSSYVPDYYGFNSFYPDTDYGCNRYANGVVYEVDCATGLIEDVVPLYAGGYGVGQMLPSAYYNVPYNYRDLYYDTADTGYYYAPGAIYQYDPRSSMITSVAALLTPGFGIGQPLPAGYGVYNVPYGYRDTYFDTANDWYRYNNGAIYRVDPTTQLVTALVASILT